MLFSDSDVWPAFDHWCHLRTTFTLGAESGTYTSSSTSPNCDLNVDASGGYISGDGDCFTLYSAGEFDFEGCVGTSVNILSTCLNADLNMVAPRSATKILTLVGDSCDAMVSEGRLSGEGHINVTTETDGLARRVQ